LFGCESFAADASLIQADANKQRSLPSDEWDIDSLPHDAGRSTREYLEALNDAAFGAAFFAYATNYLIDTDNAVIMDVEGTRAIRQAEVGSVRTMIDRVANRFDIKPPQLIGDSAYGAADNLNWLVNIKDIKPHVPVFDNSHRTDGTFSRSDFTWHADKNSYTCPKGKLLRTTGTVHDGKTRFYRSSKSDCDPCPLKSKCCPKAPHRKIPRDIHEDARDVARSIAKTQEYETSRRNRKKVEMLFAHLKRILKLGRLRLQGPNGAKDEFLLAATAQNLRKLAKLRYKPPPDIASMHRNPFSGGDTSPKQ
jgi:hypothetical protein